jgi:predicted nucleic acid-binding Zn ribbon protein
MNTIPPSTKRNCVVCQKLIYGRTDKVFCSIECKNHYHRVYKKEKKTVTFNIDAILTKNYQIIAGMMPPGVFKIKISKLDLERVGFLPNYYTHLDNEGNKWIYNFQILIEGDVIEIATSNKRKTHNPFIYERWYRKISPTLQIGAE